MKVEFITGPPGYDEQVLDQDSAADILARAAEIDARLRDRVSLSTLRRAAEEAGISSEAFDVAARSTMSPQAPPAAAALVATRRANDGFSFVLPTAVGLGALAGWVDRATGGNDVWIVAPIGAAAVMSLILAASHRRLARVRRFLREHLGLWVAMAAGAWVSDPVRSSEIWEEVFALLGGSMAVTAVVGAFIVSARFVREAEQPAPDLGG